MEIIINKTVLFEYFSGRVSPLQKKAVENWLAQADHREVYYQHLHEWETAHLQTSTDWQIAFARTTQRVGQFVLENGAPAETVETAKPTATWWQQITYGSGRAWAIAASVLLVLGVSSWLFRDQLLYQTVQTTYGEVQRVTLPDGSVATLNANSSVRYPRFGFGQVSLPGLTTDSRTVTLTGEADFAVRHLPTHERFVVLTAKGLTVTVLGTEFTVLSRPRTTRVVLHSGRIVLGVPTKMGQSALTMRPGDLATLGPGGQLTLTTRQHTEALSAWKQHRFTFEQTPLREIAAMLGETYGLTVVVASPDLADRTISGSFPARSADEVLALVAELLQVNYHRDGNLVTLTD